MMIKLLSCLSNLFFVNHNKLISSHIAGIRNQDWDGKNRSMVDFAGGTENRDTTIKEVADATKQIAAGTIPGPTKYSPPYPD